MDIELYSLLSTVIVIVTGATSVFAVYSYLMFRVREQRSVRRRAAEREGREQIAPRFFRRYQPEQATGGSQ